MSSLGQALDAVAPAEILHLCDHFNHSGETEGGGVLGMVWCELLSEA
jgi:hypothetical protein